MVNKHKKLIEQLKREGSIGQFELDANPLEIAVIDN